MTNKETASTEETRRFFDSMAEGWDQHVYHDAHKLALITNLCFLRPGARILDVGCGTGAMFDSLLATEPQSLTGLDLSARMIEVARRKYSDPRLHLAAVDLFAFTETDFDLVMVYSAYPHFTARAALAAHLARRLRTGGRLMIAHSQSRACINGRHSGTEVSRVSAALAPVDTEAQYFQPYFALDILIDTAELYLFSGLKKAAAAACPE